MTPDEALAIYQAGPETAVRVLLEMDARLAVNQQRVRNLEGRLAKDSHNSSKPPSSDGLNKPKPKSLRARRAVPRWPARTCGPDLALGGEAGFGGVPSGESVRRLRAFIDRTAAGPPRAPPSLRSARTETGGHRTPGRNQNLSLRLPQPRCVSPEAAAPAQYGLRVKSVAVYLKEYQLLPFDRPAEIMRDLFACGTFSEGTLANFTAACSRRLEPIDVIIREQVSAAEVAGFDETGMRATGSLHWVHTVSTHWLTWYFAHEKRGREAMDAAGVLPDFKGRAVHNFWSPYLQYHCGHAFCNAHLLRELVFLWEEGAQAQAKDMIDHLRTIKTAVDTARQVGQTALPGDILNCFHVRYLRIVDAGYAQNPAPEPPNGIKRRGRLKQSKAGNLLDRFRDHSGGILAFMRDFAVPFDNNLPERDLRMMKLRQKISGTFRSIDALADFCRIRGYVSTARQNGLNALDALRRIFLGNPYVPEAKIPSPAHRWQRKTQSPTLLTKHTGRHAYLSSYK